MRLDRRRDEDDRGALRGGDREAEAARLRRVPRGLVRGVHGRGAGDSFAVVGAPGGVSVVLINFL